MNEPAITALDLTGQNSEPIPNKFFRQHEPAAELAIVFPGLRYTCDMPLLYYTTRLLVKRGADVLQLHTDYNRPDFESASPIARAQWIGSDALAGLQAGQSQRSYERLVLVGKSIGTLAMGFLLAGGTAPLAATIWLTPLLHQPLLVQAACLCTGPALFAVGEADSTYDANAIHQIQQATRAQVVVLEGANHSLEVPGDLKRSIQHLGTVMEAITRTIA
jgi:predicted alpha/beta-hydrolase family hydrolase